MGARSVGLLAVVLFAISCGAPRATAAVTPVPTKPVPTATRSVAGSPSSWVKPFAAVWFIGPTEGWAVILSNEDRAVQTIHTLDGGATWSAPAQVTSLDVPAGDGPPHASIRFATSQLGWVAVNGIWATTDGGKTWIDTGVHGTLLSATARGR